MTPLKTVLRIALQIVAALIGSAYGFAAFKLLVDYSYDDGFWPIIGYLWGTSAMVVLSVLLVGVGIGVWRIELSERRIER
jgi:hypothetical protein